MDSFYLIVISIALLLLVLLLVSFGIILKRGKSAVSYPKNPPECPDYWTSNPAVDNTGKVSYTCGLPPQYRFAKIQKYGKQSIAETDYDATKNTINFSSTNWGGTVGACNKYRWAMANNIAWDGITNVSPPCDALVLTSSGSKNLSFYYTFDKSSVSASGVTLLNRVTSSYDATMVNGATVQADNYKVGDAALYLDSTKSQYVSIGPIDFTTNGLTFCCWFNTTTGGWARLFDFGNGEGNNNILYSPGNGIYLQQGGGPNVTYTGAGAGMNDGNWHFFAWTLTYAGTGSATSTWNLYIDGTNKYSSSTCYYPVITTRTKNYIGKSNWSNDAYTTVYVDDFRIYDRVLDLSELSKIKASTSNAT
jgi:hypothetical protein